VRKLKEMKIFLITLILTLFIHESFSCDCKDRKDLDSARIIEFNNSELVILGEVISISDDQLNYKVRVVEIFKGDLKTSQIIEAENHQYCVPFVYFTGKWLLYGSIQNGKFKVNICGLSRSLDFPEKNRYFRAPPPPPPPLYPRDSLKYKAILKESEGAEKEYKIRARKELNKEIELLRTKPAHNKGCYEEK
jgi:hypothetical protein